jgi:hypothetical protein
VAIAGEVDEARVIKRGLRGFQGFGCGFKIGRAHLIALARAPRRSTGRQGLRFHCKTVGKKLALGFKERRL